MLWVRLFGPTPWKLTAIRIRKTYLLHSVTFQTVLIKFYWVDPSDGFPARPPRKSIREVEMRRRYGPILHSSSPGGGGGVIASKLLSLPTSVFIIPHSSLHKRPQSYLRACNAWVWEMGSISRLLWVIHISLIWTVPSSLKMDLSSLFLFLFLFFDWNQVIRRLLRIGRAC